MRVKTMIRSLTVMLVTLALAGTARAGVADLLAQAAADAERVAAGRLVEDLLVTAIDRGAPMYNDGDPRGCARLYAEAARFAAALPGASAFVRDTLVAALAAAERETDPREAAWALRRAMDAVLAGEPDGDAVPGLEVPAGFTPVSEADLPAGFPGPGPAGRLVVKEYPAYRAARAEGGRAAFWTLFRHIKSRDVAMTAPVEMTMRADGGAEVLDMSFLYGRPDQGRAGKDGAVEVMDLPAVTVLSVGLNGPVTEERAATARKAIEAHLAADPGLKAAGEYRLLGYNSPMVPEARRFYEIQLPVTTPAMR